MSLTGLTGVLEYPYSNQGYGPLQSIPLYYGVAWISAVLAERLLMCSAENLPNATFWSKGWGDVWRRMAEPVDDENKIITGASVTSITRSSMSGS